MKKVFRSFAVAVSLLSLLPSCFSSDWNARLDEIDAIVRERPGDAITQLAAIDKNAMRRRDRAKYDLIYATALERSFSDTSDVNLILPALRYFEKHRSKDLLMRAYHCLGRFYQNGEDWQNAFLSYKKAEELSIDSTDLYFKTILSSAIRYVLGSTHHNEEWLDYCKKTLDYSEQYGKDSSWISRNLMEYAGALSDCGFYDKSDSAFNAAGLLLSRSSANEAELLFGAETAMKKIGINPVLAIKYTEEALSKGARLKEDLAYSYSYALILQGQNEKAQTLLDSLRAFAPSINSCFWNYKICRRQKDYKSAMEYCEEFDRLRFEDYNNKNNQSVHKAEAERNEVLAALSKTKSHLYRLMFVLALLILAAILFLGYYYISFLKRKREEELSRIADIAEESSRLLAIANNDYQQLKGSHTDLEEKYFKLQHSFCLAYQNQLSELGRLCEKGISDSDAYSIKNRALTHTSARIEKFINDINRKASGQKELEKVINANLDNIITKIREDFPEFNNEDILFICYMAMHFDTTTIAFLADKTKTNIRVKRHRYREKLFSKNTPNSELYRVVFH